MTRFSLTRRARLLAYAVCAAWLVSGCGRFKKAKECGLLVDAVSSWLRKASPASAPDADTAALVADAQATARRYRELDRTLSEIKLESAELTPLVAKYRQIAAKSAQALEDVSKALGESDLERARQLRVDFDTTLRSEAPLVNEINAVCRR